MVYDICLKAVEFLYLKTPHLFLSLGYYTLLYTTVHYSTLLYTTVHSKHFSNLKSETGIITRLGKSSLRCYFQELLLSIQTNDYLGKSYNKHTV